MEQKQILPVEMVKQESDEGDIIIDLDKYVSIREEAEEWDLKVRSHLQDVTSFGCERKLDSTMKWYIESLKNEASSLKDHNLVQSCIIKHLYTFKGCLIQLDYCYIDNYLDNMEEILTFYANLQLKLLPKWGPGKNFRIQINQTYRKLVYYIKLYLLGREDRALHVLMKMNVDMHSNECKSLMNQMYRAFLRREPKEKTDLAFCRAYILFQQWKKIKGKSYWESLDALMYTLFNRTPEELQTNETLKRVLLVEHNSILDAFAHIDNDNLIMVRKYFESIQPENIQNVNFLHSGFDEPDESIELGSSKTQEEQGLRDYYINYRKSMDLVPTPNTVELKEENDSDDDCQFVGVVMDAPEIIHEIYDDDIQEIVIWKQNTSVQDSSDSSFLNAITIPSEHDDSESQKVDEQIRLSGDGPVIGDEIISRTDKDGNDHSHQRKASNNMQQSSAQDKINKGPSDLPPSDENVADLSKAVAETVVISLSDNEEESTVTGNPKSMDNSPAVVSQSKDTSTIHETCDLEETFCENQRTSSKEKTSDSETRDQIYTSTPSKHVTDTFFNGSEVSISSPSSSNLPNHTPNRSEDPYASPNHPDISSTTCTEGSEQCLETEQCTISENLTDICIENNTQSLLGDGDDVTIESPDLINDKQCTSVADDASDEKAGAVSETTEPSCTTPADIVEEQPTKRPELSVILEKINTSHTTSFRNNNLENSMFTKMPDKSDLRRMNGQKTWEDGKDTHELDNFMSGPVQNYVSGSVLPGEDFDDLFDDTACTSNADTQIAPSISSYEKRVDAFKVYFEETSREKALAVSETHQKVSSVSSMGKHQTTILKKRDNLNESDKPRTSKVKRVTFDERSIMRKEIPKMSTLKRTDWKLKDSPYVSLEKLTEAQIDQRLKQMSEIARIARLEKEHRARSQNQNKQNTTLFKIDYDKTEVSLTQREVEQVRNIFLDNFQEDEVVVNKPPAVVSKSVEGLKTTHANGERIKRGKTKRYVNGKRTKQCDDEVDKYDSALQPAKRKRGRLKKGT